MAGAVSRGVTENLVIALKPSERSKRAARQTSVMQIEIGVGGGCAGKYI